jgi:hypothetical protein
MSFLAPHIRFLMLWTFINTLILSFGFLGSTSWYITFAAKGTPSIGYPLPLGDQGIVVSGTILGAVQFLLMRRFLKKNLLIRWIMSTIVGLYLAAIVRALIFLICILINSDTDVLNELDMLIGGIAGILGGLIGGGLIGLIQIFGTQLRKLWILINALAWGSGWSIGWIAMQSLFARGLSDNQFNYLDSLVLKMWIYGTVLGFVSGLITGIGLIFCRKPEVM